VNNSFSNQEDMFRAMNTEYLMHRTFDPNTILMGIQPYGDKDKVQFLFDKCAIRGLSRVRQEKIRDELKIWLDTMERIVENDDK
jgi:hypothetical protein